MNGAAPYGFFYSVGLRIYSVELCVTKKVTDLSASGGVTQSLNTEYHRGIFTLWDFVLLRETLCN